MILVGGSYKFSVNVVGGLVKGNYVLSSDKE